MEKKVRSKTVQINRLPLGAAANNPMRPLGHTILILHNSKKVLGNFIWQECVCRGVSREQCSLPGQMLLYTVDVILCT